MRDVHERRDESGGTEAVAATPGGTNPASEKNLPAEKKSPAHGDATPPLTPDNRRRLTHLLFAKSIVEILFVGLLGVIFYYQTFNVHVRGALDRADARRVEGWAVDEREPHRRVVVYLYVNDLFVASREADAFRPDVRAAGRAHDERHGFIFDTPPLPPGAYEARVYAPHDGGGPRHRTLQLIGRPLNFRVVESGP